MIVSMTVTNFVKYLLGIDDFTLTYLYCVARSSNGNVSDL